MSRDWRTFPKLGTWEWIAFGVILANFFVFLIVSIWLGGTADNGMVGPGKYFLGHNNRFTEVTRDVFLYSKLHQKIVIVGWVAGAGILIFAKARELMAPTHLEE